MDHCNCRGVVWGKPAASYDADVCFENKLVPADETGCIDDDDDDQHHHDWFVYCVRIEMSWGGL